ncbi:GNAT family N-acetyltransferase [Gracilibacillus caseinilyticus]|uniref:GNAT family N-acetyltransferase n=1 Tax=Gracilibacillus caseinilyticus TaxID=2932256 RepID=A0ABY4EXK3_9BACI|nr:GNAT family protein [Gracilibacillus caseinilyticus]UOQ46886.1 GNAT family N-acetyltransferase [Gracilibacillus caseinilyticus]
MFYHKIDEELSLKLIELKDAEKVFALTESSRDYLREWLPWLDFTTKLEDTKAFIRNSLKGYAEGESLTTFIVYQNEIVGTASYNNLDRSNKIAYIGYWLGEDYQGKGIMTRVAGALTDYAINELNMNKVDIRAAAQNQKSRAVPEQLGFVQEGSVRQAEWLYDHYVDHVIYGMLADEWKKA